MTPHPFTYRQNHIYVPVSIGDEAIQAEFLLDTGCSQTVLSTSFLGRVHLPIAGVRGSHAFALSGPIEHSVGGIALPSLTVAGQTLANVEVTQVNANPLKSQFGSAPDGVLGVNVLRHFETVLDFPSRAITLTPLDESGDLDQQSALSEDREGIFNAHLRDGWLFELEGRIADRATVTVLIDLGAPRSILNWNAARAIGYSPESPELLPGESPMQGMDGRSLTPLYAPPMRVSIGNLTWPNSVLAIADMPIIREMHIGYMPVLLLGTDLLSQLRVVLNYPMARVGLFTQAPPGPP